MQPLKAQERQGKSQNKDKDCVRSQHLCHPRDLAIYDGKCRPCGLRPSPPGDRTRKAWRGENLVARTQLRGPEEGNELGDKQLDNFA